MINNTLNKEELLILRELVHEKKLKIKKSKNNKDLLLYSYLYDKLNNMISIMELMDNE